MSACAVNLRRRLKMANTDIKGVIFDYGGTIDSRGDHWSEVIWDGYREAGVQVTKEQFRDCYVYAERELAKTRHILPEHNFYDLLLIKMRIEIGNLVENAVLPSDYPVEEKALAVARYCYNRAKESVEEARQVLEFVYERVPMVLVSNFYGNVETVLADFDLARYFKKVVESAVVGIRSPIRAFSRSVWRLLASRQRMCLSLATAIRRISCRLSLLDARWRGSKEKDGRRRKMPSRIPK